MIVKREESGQYVLFPSYKPLYANCKTCARLIPDGKCEHCGVNEYTARTPWYRMDQIKTPASRNRNRKVGIKRIVTDILKNI